jgi:HMG (high mobility group) box
VVKLPRAAKKVCWIGLVRLLALGLPSNKRCVLLLCSQKERSQCPQATNHSVHFFLKSESSQGQSRHSRNEFWRGGKYIIFVCTTATSYGRRLILVSILAYTSTRQGKKIGELFKALSPDERAKYDEMNKKDIERYNKELAAYESKQKGGNDSEEDGKGKKADNDSDSDSDDSDDSESE